MSPEADRRVLVHERDVPLEERGAELVVVVAEGHVLAARAEHYWVTVVCFAFATNWIAGAMAVQLALWFFAGVSKLNHHFPTVVAVMTSNGPFTRFEWMRKLMYKSYPTDLRPSTLASVMAL